MANTTLTRPVVTMNLANRSITRLGLATNRILHPLVARRFGREIGTLTQMSDVKITPSAAGIKAQTELGETSINLPLYTKLLSKAGVDEIALPKGSSADQIGDIFRSVTMRTPAKAERMLGNTTFTSSSIDIATEIKPSSLFRTCMVLRLIKSAINSYPDKAMRAFHKLNTMGLSSIQLASLAKSEHRHVRREVAKHPNTSIELLIDIAIKDPEICWVAYNAIERRGALNSEILLQLSKSPFRAVIKEIARNSLTPLDTLVEFATNYEEAERLIENNVYTDNGMTRKESERYFDLGFCQASCADYHDRYIAMIALNNMRKRGLSTPTILHELATESKCVIVRMEIAKDPDIGLSVSTIADILCQLKPNSRRTKIGEKEISFEPEWEMISADHDGETWGWVDKSYIEDIFGDPKAWFFQKDLQLARQILEAREDDKQEILTQLRTLNPDLYSKLIQVV